jgi:hypothetical protein
VTVILFVVDVPDQPPGNPHVYDVAPATAATEYTFEEPLQTVLFPETEAGCAGGLQFASVNTCEELYT